MSDQSVTVTLEEITRVKALGFLHCKGTNNFNGRVITKNGKITGAELKCIQEAAEKYGNGEVAMTTRMTLECQQIPYENIEPFREYLTQCGLYTGGTGKRVRPVTACKGTTCQYGLIDVHALSEKIHDRIFEGMSDVELPHKFKIAVGGCPNNCVKPNLNDLGIVGQRVPTFQEDICKGCKKCACEAICPVHACHVENGKLVISDKCTRCGRCVDKCYFHSMGEGKYGYKVYIGGRWGKEYAIGKPLSKLLHSEAEVLDICEKTVLLFRDKGILGERFSDTIARIGFEEAERILLSDELFERKEEILNRDVQKN